MRTVSFQGTQLSAAQRRQLAFQQQARQSFMNPILAKSVDDAIAAQQRAAEQGAQPEDPYKFRLDHASKGTPWLGDVFGF